jgi:class 3 adenylate cyclase
MGASPITRYTEVGEEQIAFQIVGDGDRDLVWFSGLSNIDLQWADAQMARALERLSSYGRLLVFDRRGTGISDHLSSGQLPTWEDWSEDVTAVLDAAGSEQAAIFAISDGGPLGILFAALHPERVSALVLHNTTARYLVADDYPIGRSAASVERMLAGFEQLWGTEDWASVVEGRKGEDEDTLRRVALLTRGMATPRRAKAQWRYLLMDMDVRAALPLVQAPTLVRHDSDAIFPLSHGRFIADRIPNAEFQEVSRRFDLGSLADPEVILEWLTGELHPVEVDRVLTAVLFTDIVGSTEMAADLGDRRWGELLDRHDEVIRGALLRFRGRAVKGTGDGVLATFDGPGRAIRCAEAISHSVNHLGISVRAGLHVGECDVRGEDLGGIAVHIASRIADLAAPGEVLVSRTVVDLAVGSGFSFQERDTHQLRGVPGSWPLFAARSNDRYVVDG